MPKASAALYRLIANSSPFTSVENRIWPQIVHQPKREHDDQKSCKTTEFLYWVQFIMGNNEVVFFAAVIRVVTQRSSPPVGKSVAWRPQKRLRRRLAMKSITHLLQNRMPKCGCAREKWGVGGLEKGNPFLLPRAPELLLFYSPSNASYVDYDTRIRLA